MQINDSMIHLLHASVNFAEQMKNFSFLFLIFWLSSVGCAQPPESKTDVPLRVGAERFSAYQKTLDGKKVGVVINQTSQVGDESTLDFLLKNGVQVTKIYAPEHGFRGTADRGVNIDDAKDEATGLPIISIYGKNKKPSKEALQDIDVVIFDIQDVGARFYTYISTMHYVMEACAENGKQLIIMDRPNPNGDYVTGPIMKDEHKSFIGMHNVPVVHGMTIGEYALMINGEGWLANGQQCSLEIVKMEGWDHNALYSLPIPPSPNLPNDQSIALYPSLCFFEGTPVSVGRGTTNQFQIIGHPQYSNTTFSFTPVSSYGAKYPVLQDSLCYGLDLRDSDTDFTLKYLIQFHDELKDSQKPFFTDFFTLLAGTEELQAQIEAGLTEKEIINSWQPGLEAFKQIRSKYLLYKDFE